MEKTVKNLLRYLKIQLDTDLKIILSDRRSNYVQAGYQKCQPFYSIAHYTCLT